MSNSRRCKNPLLKVQLLWSRLYLISKPDMPSKGQIVNQLIDGVLLMPNANIELNRRCREALKPELHTSYRYRCALSNLITTELFGDDLPKAVKDITDTNRITSKLSKESKQTFKRSRSDGHSDRCQVKGVIILCRQKTTVALLSTRRRVGENAVQKNQN